MKHSIFIFVSALSLLLAMSCQQDVAYGYLSVNVNSSEVVTKASMSSEEILQNARVSIYYADFSGLIRSYSYSSAPQYIWLPVNDYRVDVEAGECVRENPSLASWDSKSWAGSTVFHINPSSVTSVTVKATVSDAISKISFDPTIAANFKSGYSLEIGVSDDAVLSYGAANSGQEGYFIISDIDEPQFNWTFDGVLTKGGKEFSKSGVIKDIKPGCVYALSLKYTVKDGDLTFELLVDDSTDNREDIIIFDPLSTGLSSSSPYEIWAAHATVHADVDESEYSDPSAIVFKYSSDGNTWLSCAAHRDSEGSYSAVLAGLAPQTEYSYKLVIAGEEIGEPMNFTTEAAPQVPNASFEETSKSASGNYTEFFNPSSSFADCRTAWWGSGNGSEGVNGSADFGGYIIAKPDTSVKMDGNQSALLCSTWAIVKFAAGNLFSGKFAGLVGTSGGKVDFGRPFTARPTALKLYLKYSTGKVNRISSYPASDPVTSSDYDRARVQIALGTWDYKKYGGTKDCPVQVNTTDASTFVDYSTDPSTIAYGEYVIRGNASNSTDVWREVTIPLVYSSETKYPTHIIISCAASMLGDYFTGCDSSKLWIDKVQLIYE